MSVHIGTRSSAAANHGSADGEPVDDSAVATNKSVERAARILGFFTPSRPRLTLGEIVARLGASKATAHRYAVALRKVNLLRYDRLTGEYTLGPQILTLAAAARSGLPIIALAGPLMESLVREVNETVVLSVWDGERPVVIRVDDGTDRILRISVRAGARLEVDSSQGKVFAAYLSDESNSELVRLTSLSEVASELASVREVGLAMSNPGRHGVRTVAAPIFNDGAIAAVLALVGTTTTLPDDISSSAAKALKRTAQRLTEEFGTYGSRESTPSARTMSGS